MEILKIKNNKPEKNLIKKAAGILKVGGLLVYPTDTAYGLGCNAFSKNALMKLYKAKGRDLSKPTHVVVRDWQMIDKITHTGKFSKILYENFLPGPLTMILPKKEIVPDILTANLPTLGVRIPSHPVTQHLSSIVPFAYTTPSANREGGETPYSIGDVKRELNLSHVDMVLDAGKIPKNPPSTLVDLSKSTPEILREGAITESQILKKLTLKPQVFVK